MTLCRRGRSVFAWTLVRGLAATLGLLIRAPLKDSVLTLSPVPLSPGHTIPLEHRQNTSRAPGRASLPFETPAHSTSCRYHRFGAIRAEIGALETVRWRT